MKHVFVYNDELVTESDLKQFQFLVYEIYTTTWKYVYKCKLKFLFSEPNKTFN